MAKRAPPAKPAPAAKRAAKPAPAPTPPEPAPAPPAPAKRAAKAKPAAAPAAPAEPPVPLGVYCDEHRYTAIAIRNTDQGVWYLTMITEQITVEHAGKERFRRLFPLAAPDYDIRIAVRKYHTSLLRRDETTQKVLNMLMRTL